MICIECGIFEDLLYGEKDDEGDKDAHEVTDRIAIVQCLVSHALTHIVSYHLVIWKKGIRVPIVDKVLTVQTALYIIVSSYTIFVEFVLKWKNLDSQKWKEIDFKIFLNGHIAKLGLFHVEKKLHFSINSCNDGFV